MRNRAVAAVNEAVDRAAAVKVLDKGKLHRYRYGYSRETTVSGKLL